MKAGFSCGLLEEENTRVLVPFVMWSILLYGIYYFVDPAYYGFDLRISPPPRLSEKSAIQSSIGLLRYSGRGRSTRRGIFRTGSPSLSEKSELRSIASCDAMAGVKSQDEILFGQASPCPNLPR